MLTLGIAFTIRQASLPQYPQNSPDFLLATVKLIKIESALMPEQIPQTAFRKSRPVIGFQRFHWPGNVVLTVHPGPCARIIMIRKTERMRSSSALSLFHYLSS
jgi:hypothetical protein